MDKSISAMIEMRNETLAQVREANARLEVAEECLKEALIKDRHYSMLSVNYARLKQANRNGAFG